MENRYLKLLFYKLFFALIICSSAYSQSGIVQKKLNISSYPKVSTEIYIFDQNSNTPAQSYTSNNLVVFDNGKVPINLELINPSQNPKVNLSINFIMDLGLDAGGTGLNNRFQIGKNLVRNMVQISDSINQEFALTSFDNINYLNQNFTQSKSKVISALNLLNPEFSSSLDQAFIDKPAGSVEIHKTSKFDKISIIITDASGLIDKAKVISELKSQNIKVFFLVIGKPISKDLLEICTETNGFFHDEITDKTDLFLIAKYILSMASDYLPSIINYENEFTCNDVHDVEINIPGKGYQLKFNYNVISQRKPILVSNPKALGFSSVLPSTFKDLDIVITAVNSDITISKFFIQDPRFTIVAGNISQDLILKENNNHKLTIRYSPTDSAITFTTLQITSSACLGNEIYLTGGFPNTPPIDRTVKLLTPTCEQTLIPGDTVSIIWTGLLPQDVIQLEYSTDNGKTWDTLARNLTDLVYLWTVPNIQSNECLIRAIQLWPNNVGRTLDLNHKGEVNSAFFNADGSLAVTASSDHSIGIWNANSGKIKFWLMEHTDQVKYAVFNHVGDKIASIGMDNQIILWDVTTGKKILSKQITAVPQSINFSPDDSKLVIACNTGCASILNSSDLSDNKIIPAHTNTGVCWYAEFSPDGDKILSAGNDGIAKVWNWQDDITSPIEQYNTQQGGFGNIIHATYNYNASKIAVSSWTTKKLYVFDTAIQDTLYTVTHNDKPEDNKILNSSSFNVDAKYGERILTAAQDNVRLWDANTGIPANPHIIQEHRESVRTAVFNFDSKRILTSSWDSTAKIWNLEQRDLQMDTTDCTFRIKPLSLELANIDFPPVPINDSKDSTINEFLINRSDFNFEIRNIELVGNSNGDFQIIKQSETPFLLDTLYPTPITILFRPSKPGYITDTIKIRTGGGTFSAVLTGTGLDKGLFAFANLIDFGQIELGDSKDSVIKMIVINKSVSDIEITDNRIQMPDTLHFSLVDDIDKKLLKPNETAGIQLRYTPSALEINNGTLAIEHNGNLSPLKIALLGEGVIPRVDTLTLSASDISGEPGQIIEMPIYIRNLSPNGIKSSITGFTTNLRFNSSLLLPLDYFPSYLDGSERVMQISLPTQFGPDSILTKLKFKVALGNDTISTMKLEYTAPIGLGKVLISENEGKFRLKGFCEEETPRLFDSDGKIFLKQTFPNPAINSITLSFSLIETDLTKLYIIDITGKIVKYILDEIAQKGEYSVQVDISDLPSGQYRYILETPTRKFTNNLIIHR